MKYQTLMNSMNKSYRSGSIEESDLSLMRGIVFDSSYLDFIASSNGGFFYKNSIQIYAISQTPAYNNFFNINEMIRKEYGNILSDEIFFGQEIFGNQFAFTSSGVVFFNIETGERTEMGKTFLEWTSILTSDINYYSGINILKSWTAANLDLSIDNRLCPKKPFVIGGEYEIKNLYPAPYPQYIKANANIANQIYGLPDGTPIKLKITD